MACVLELDSYSNLIKKVYFFNNQPLD